MFEINVTQHKLNYIKKHIDLYSGESFIPKRSNQRFAYKAHQNAFNNAKDKNVP